MEKRKIKIDELKKDNLFQVPEGYFEELPSIIQARVTEDRKADPIWIFQPAFSWAAVAASVLIFGVYFAFFRIGTDATSNVELLIAEVSMEDLVGYIENSDLTTEELIASVDLEGFSYEDLAPEDMFLEDIEIYDLESIDLLEAIDVSPELL